MGSTLPIALQAVSGVPRAQVVPAGGWAGAVSQLAFQISFARRIAVGGRRAVPPRGGWVLPRERLWAQTGPEQQRPHIAATLVAL